jgi:hypothetical protein
LLSIYCLFFTIFEYVLLFWMYFVLCVNFIGSEFKWYNKNSPISIR